MKYLLDTHSLLWAIFEPDKLSPKAQRIILDQDNIICVSLISLWEISIKRNIGRLNIPEEFFATVSTGGFEILSLTMSNIEKYQTLPLHHRDPFDRMLINYQLSIFNCLLPLTKNFIKSDRSRYRSI